MGDAMQFRTSKKRGRSAASGDDIKAMWLFYTAMRGRPDEYIQMAMDWLAARFQADRDLAGYRVPDDDAR